MGERVKLELADVQRAHSSDERASHQGAGESVAGQQHEGGLLRFNAHIANIWLHP